MADLARQDILCATLVPTRGEPRGETIMQPGISLIEIAFDRTRWEDVPRAASARIPADIKHRQRYFEVWRVERDLSHFRTLTGATPPLFLPHAVARAAVASVLQRAGLGVATDSGVLGCTLTLQELLDATGSVKVLPLDVLRPHLSGGSCTLRWEGWLGDQRKLLGDAISAWPSALSSAPPAAS